MTSAGGVDFAIFRILDAPRERVWHALTEPEHMKEWWTPATFTMIAMNMDFRPGGFFHIGMQSGEGYKMWAKYVYQEIVPPERIVWTEPGTGVITTSTFTDLGGARTEVRIHQAKVPDYARSPEAQAGFLTSLDRFAAYLKTGVS